MEENQKPNIPLLCRKGCGFYGSPNFDGLCSKCHRCAQVQQNARESRLSVADLRKSPEPPVEAILKQDSPALTPEKDSPVKSRHSSDTSSSATTVVGSDGSSSTISDPKLSPHLDEEDTEASLSACSVGDKSDVTSFPAPKKPRRCEVCRKPVGLASGYTCRCEGLFCSLHRYSDAHNCSFDYRKAGQEDIRRTNPQIICPKLPKI